MSELIPSAHYVGRFYADKDEVEVVASFRYGGDARDFVQAQLESDRKRDLGAARYIISSQWDGSVSLYSQKPHPEAA